MNDRLHSHLVEWRGDFCGESVVGQPRTDEREPTHYPDFEIVLAEGAQREQGSAQQNQQSNSAAVGLATPSFATEFKIDDRDAFISMR